LVRGKFVGKGGGGGTPGGNAGRRTKAEYLGFVRHEASDAVLLKNIRYLFKSMIPGGRGLVKSYRNKESQEEKKCRRIGDVCVDHGSAKSPFRPAMVSGEIALNAGD